jgi:hypothetical protein
MTPALFRAVCRRLATSQPERKELHHGTQHNNRSKHRTQNSRLPSMACHEQRRQFVLDQGWSRMAPPRRQGAFADPLGHPDERPDRPSPAASQAMNIIRGALRRAPVLDPTACRSYGTLHRKWIFGGIAGGILSKKNTRKTSVSML